MTEDVVFIFMEKGSVVGAGMVEKSLKVDRISAVLVFSEAYCADEKLIPNRCAEKSTLATTDFDK